MHEIGIVQGTLELALESAQAHAASKILSLRMRVGAMTGVVPEALQFAFEALREGTIASEAILEVEMVPVECWCGECQMTFGAEDWLQQCPQCHKVSAEMRHGLELELASMEVN